MNVVDKGLWEEVKKAIKNKYNKRWNAFYSGLAVQEYKRRGGRYSGKKPSPKENTLRRWYAEQWKNLAPTDDIIVFRPTKRITRDTPLTTSEISKQEIEKKISEKRDIMGTLKNLSPFKQKNHGKAKRV